MIFDDGSTSSAPPLPFAVGSSNGNNPSSIKAPIIQDGLYDDNSHRSFQTVPIQYGSWESAAPVSQAPVACQAATTYSNSGMSDHFSFCSQPSPGLTEDASTCSGSTSLAASPIDSNQWPTQLNADSTASFGPWQLTSAAAMESLGSMTAPRIQLQQPVPQTMWTAWTQGGRNSQEIIGSAPFDDAPWTYKDQVVGLNEEQSCQGQPQPFHGQVAAVNIMPPQVFGSSMPPQPQGVPRELVLPPAVSTYEGRAWDAPRFQSCKSFFAPHDNAYRVAKPGRPHVHKGNYRMPTDADDLLVKLKGTGWSYRKIKETLGLREAESTLRGRFRTMTKAKHERVRTPEWQEIDVSIQKSH